MKEGEAQKTGNDENPNDAGVEGANAGTTGGGSGGGAGGEGGNAADGGGHGGGAAGQGGGVGEDSASDVGTQAADAYSSSVGESRYDYSVAESGYADANWNNEAWTHWRRRERRRNRDQGRADGNRWKRRDGADKDAIESRVRKGGVSDRALHTREYNKSRGTYTQAHKRERRTEDGLKRR